MKVVPLAEITNPLQLVVDTDRFYISQRATIYIYSLKDFRLIKKFGRSGEGPQEFKVFAVITVQPDHLFINSMGKVSYFKKDGTFIKEIRARVEGGAYKPLAEKIVGYTFKMARKGKETLNYKTLNLFDDHLNKGKEIFQQELDWQQGKGTKLFMAPFRFETFDNKVFMAGRKNFKIDVFDSNGKQLYIISHNYENLKFTPQHKEEVLYNWRINPRTKANYEEWKRDAIYPDYLPAIRNFQLADNKLYVLTYKTKEDKVEFFVFDLRGKLLKTIYLPLVDKTFFRAFPFSIKDNKFYQLVEKEDSDFMELHIYDTEE